MSFYLGRERSQIMSKEIVRSIIKRFSLILLRRSLTQSRRVLLLCDCVSVSLENIGTYKRMYIGCRTLGEFSHPCHQALINLSRLILKLHRDLQQDGSIKSNFLFFEGV